MHVFNIPASAPFLRTLIAALVDGQIVAGFKPRDQPERLADATLYLPTRRAGRLAHEIFLDVLGYDAAILPRIIALGEPDEEELAFAQAAAPETAEALNIAPALDGLPRRLLLARLIGAWAKTQRPSDPSQSPLVIGGPASTLSLADDLARLMDDMATRQVDWRALDTLVPDDLDEYWQMTLRFLKIATKEWPDALQSLGMIEPAIRRDLLIDAEAKRLVANPMHPVIAAGSTGSMPSTAKLLNVIARLPNGAVVLPGLDTSLDDKAWASIAGSEDEHPSSNHPQYALHGLLHLFGIERRDVASLGAESENGREVLASEAMRPSSATAQWHKRLHEKAVAARIAAGMTKLAVIAADNSETEALAIAVAMREAYEKNLTCALVTFDRALARRVIAALGRWNLPYDDSGGDALTDTSPGLFARLIAETAASELEPATLLALLKHPLLRLGRAAGGWRKERETLEQALLRGTRPTAGCAGLVADFKSFREEHAKAKRGEESLLHRSEPRARLSDETLDAANVLIFALCAALAPFTSPDLAKPQDFNEVAAKHRAAIAALSADDNGVIAAFDGPAGNALANAFDDLAIAGASHLAVRRDDYAEVFETAFSDRQVRRPQIGNPLLRIYGPLEARLTQSDRVILGGLVEGVWPPAPRIDPWLSRPMRHALGLDLPERRIGLSAHDFAQMLGAEEVILSHAAKSGGAPAVASRFLHRLEAVAGKDRWEAALASGRTYLAFAQALDAPDRVTPAPQPQPKPPRAARPLKLSVTAIEDWFRDPYTIYAKYILRLQPLDPVDMPLSAADRGSAIHAALGQFTQDFPANLPLDPVAALRRIGAEKFAPLMERPEARALWWPRFQRIAQWFGEWETARRLNVKTVEAETEGRMQFDLGNDRVFTLTARADRIERRTDRTFAILDYKTGMPPSNKQVTLGLSPQLTLEAAILRDGGFDGIARGASVSEVAYVQINGNNPPGRERVITFKQSDGESPLMPDEAADIARAALHAFIRRFEDESEPYKSLVLPMWENRFGAYDDLARVKEWSIAVGGET
jgi:ATP-dependent helicase/nuclease subunit B